MPDEWKWAKEIVGMAERFGVLPSAVLAESTDSLRMIRLLSPTLGEADAE